MTPHQPKTQSHNQQRQKTTVTIALIALIGAGATWLMSQKALSDTIMPQVGESGLKPLPYEGTVVKTLEQFSLTSRDGITYHLNDPNNLINKVAKRRGVTQNLYQLDNIKLKGIVSPVGNYGHMGRWERQITVTAVE